MSHAASKEDQGRLAKQVDYSINNYQNSLTSQNNFANMTPSNNSDMVTRDLAICLVVGESHEYSFDLFLKIKDLMNAINDPASEDFKTLNQLEENVTVHNIALKQFCAHFYGDGTRDTQILKSNIVIAENDFLKIRAVLEKYFSPIK